MSKEIIEMSAGIYPDMQELLSLKGGGTYYISLSRKL